MRTLAIHNYYKEPGGERRVFHEETRLLEDHGHQVRRYTAHNEDIDDISRLELAKKTLWNDETYRELRELIREFQPEVIHVHNTLPLVSPSAYHAASDEGVPVVQTLHNYRLMCPAGVFFRDGEICEDCLGKSFAWPGVLHGCYKGSRTASGAVAAMVALHEKIGTWTETIDCNIALTDFARRKFIEGGLPADKIVTKPNFVYPDPGVRNEKGSFGLFVGRISKEKGVPTVVEAWQKIDEGFPLKVVGDGPLLADVLHDKEIPSHVEFLGRKPSEEVFDLMGRAAIVVIPSEWYETFGRVVTESFAVGTPAVVSDTGAISELIDHGRTGRRFEPGNPDSLAEQIRWMLDHPTEMKRLGRNARREYEQYYAPEQNYEMLTDIYRSVIRATRPETIYT